MMLRKITTQNLNCRSENTNKANGIGLECKYCNTFLFNIFLLRDGSKITFGKSCSILDVLQDR